MTVREARENGYKESFRSLTRGYVSVKADPTEQQVHSAGGNRKGLLYYLEHNPNSSQYCYRVYLKR